MPEADRVVAGQPGLAAQQELETRRNGAESLANSRAMVLARIEQMTRLDRRLADMDAAGVDLQVVSPSPSHYNYWADPALAAELSEAVNAGIAAHVAGAPDRLVGLGQVPLQHPALAADLLESAMTQHGLRGILISTHAPSLDLSDAALDPLWSRCAALSAIVFLQPYGCTLDERLRQRPPRRRGVVAERLGEVLEQPALQVLDEGEKAIGRR